MSREATNPPAAVNVLDVSSESMAAFQVFLYGRFWVFTEAEAERALEVAFRKLQADERVREEERREAILRAGSSPLGKLEPQFGGRVRD